MSQSKLHFRHLFELNLAMFFISTSGVLGRYVDLPVPVTISSRGILAFIVLLGYCRWKDISLRVRKKDLKPLLLSGILMGLHWVTYFYSLRLSNVAIGMLSIFTYPVITAILEPLLLRSKFQRAHILLGIMVLLGVFFLVPKLDVDNSTTIAIVFGVVSAIFYSLRNLIVKAKVGHYHGSMLMVYQTAVIGFIFMPSLFFVEMNALTSQWEGIVALAVMTTAIGHTMFLLTFKHFSITSVSIMSSVQPVYGILLGVLFLSELPNTSTIIGGLIILGSVVIESYRSRKTRNH